jgi:FkbM family methyltransferase
VDILKEVTGLIHIGANVGQEAELYAQHNLDVIWVEPIPNVFDRLKQNIALYPKQVALEALVTDKDDEEYTLRIANNTGASSSIYDLKDHRDIWPDIHYVDNLQKKSVTLPTLLKIQHIDFSKYQMLVLDTQGSELLVLKGAKQIINQFKAIKTEVADFEAYKDGCVLDDMIRFMQENGFGEVERIPFATHPTKGNYFDITYRKLDVSEHK